MASQQNLRRFFPVRKNISTGTKNTVVASITPSGPRTRKRPVSNAKFEVLKNVCESGNGKYVNEPVSVPNHDALTNSTTSDGDNAKNQSDSREECPSPSKSPCKKSESRLKSSAGKEVQEKGADSAPVVRASLTMPLKFTLLKQFFTSLDGIMYMLSKRNEECSFEKVKKAVEQMTKRSFTTKHLAQIVTVYPEAYKIFLEESTSCYGRNTSKGQKLVLSFNYEQLEPPVDSVGPAECVMPSSHRMLARSQVFHSRLMQRLFDEHRALLQSLSKPISVADEELTRWHPKFEVESVADVEEADLPVPRSSQKVHTAQEVLQMATSHMLTEKVKIALKKLSETCVSPEKRSEKLKSRIAGVDKAKLRESISRVKAANLTPAPTELTGVSLSLIEKVRAKEALKTARSMTCTKEDGDKLEMLERLPELARIIRGCFIASKKPALVRSDVVARITFSYKNGMSSVDADRHVSLLLETLPNWVTEHHFKGNVLLKIDRRQDLTVLTQQIKQKAKSLQ